MKRIQWFLLILLITLLGSIPDAHAQKELTIQLKFVPQEGVQTSSPDLPLALLAMSVEQRVDDARQQDDPTLIGQATGRDDKPFPVRADRDVADFVKSTLAGVGREWSLKLEEPYQRSLTLGVTRFWINETRKAVGSMYGSEVKLAFSLKDGKGQTIAEGIASGTANRYGRAQSIDNANEVLSDALKEAYASVLADTALQSAWLSGKRSGEAVAKAAPQESVEERLRKLDDLLKKGLITKEEHTTKRQEILKDL